MTTVIPEEHQKKTFDKIIEKPLETILHDGEVSLLPPPPLDMHAHTHTYDDEVNLLPPSPINTHIHTHSHSHILALLFIILFPFLKPLFYSYPPPPHPPPLEIDGELRYPLTPNTYLFYFHTRILLPQLFLAFCFIHHFLRYLCL